jgi:hypothetical protein
MEVDINWYRAFFNFSEGINWFVMAYLLVMWRWLNPPFKWLAFVFINLTIGVAISYSVYIFFDLNNRFITHLRTPLQFILISMIYYTIIESAVLKRVIMTLNILFPLFCILNALFLESFWYSSPSIPTTILHLVVIIYSIYFLYNTYVNTTVNYLTVVTNIILVLSLFFNYSSTLVQEMTITLIGYHKELHKIYYATICLIWIIHIVGIFYALRMIYIENNGRKSNGLSLKRADKTPF